MNASWRRGGCIARVYVKSVTDLKPEIKESTTQTHAVKIDNPSHSRPPPATPPDVIDLSIDFDGTLQWNKRTVDRTTMQSYITQGAVKNPQPEVPHRGRQILKVRNRGANLGGLTAPWP